MKQLRNGLARYGAELMLLIGAGAVSAGAGMIYDPLGLIVGGGFAIAGAVLSILGGGEQK